MIKQTNRLTFLLETIDSLTSINVNFTLRLNYSSFFLSIFFYLHEDDLQLIYQPIFIIYLLVLFFCFRFFIVITTRTTKKSNENKNEREENKTLTKKRKVRRRKQKRIEEN